MEVQYLNHWSPGNSLHVVILMKLWENMFMDVYSAYENCFEAEYEAEMEKSMAPDSSTLAWKIPWMEEPGRLQYTGSRRVGHD